MHINYSIDGSGKDFYEYLRWPLKWEDTIEKIDILKKYDWLTCEFAIVPHNFRFSSKYAKIYKRVKKNFSYSSENNKTFIDVKKLERIIKEYI